MSIRIGINGFGRIGRLVTRAGWHVPEISFVHINEPHGGIECAAHLLEFDSIHGHFNQKITHDKHKITVNRSAINFSEYEVPEKIDWASAKVDIVLECSGKFRTVDSINQHFKSKVKKVIVACPVKDLEALNIVYGINDHLYEPKKHNVLTAASCTTNCLAPIIKVIHENLEILHGSITTIHNVTNTQRIIDAPHRDLRRARAGFNSIIPTTTGSATAITLIYPELCGKLDGHAVRVPSLNGSLTDCVFEVKQKVTAEHVNKLLKEAAESELKGILGYDDKPLVSTDYIGNPRSAIIDSLSTIVVDGTHVKIYAWYDNEWGYANRMVDIITKVAQQMLVN